MHSYFEALAPFHNNSLKYYLIAIACLSHVSAECFWSYSENRSIFILQKENYCSNQKKNKKKKKKEQKIGHHTSLQKTYLLAQKEKVAIFY